MFCGNFAPIGSALCNGQVLPVSQDTALFSLLGTTYGGDGKTTFALPNLQGMSPMGQGDGAGLTPNVLGQVGGAATVTLTTAQIPSHSHVPQVLPPPAPPRHPRGPLGPKTATSCTRQQAAPWRP